MHPSATQPPAHRTQKTNSGARRIVATVLTSTLFITAPLAVPAFADPEDTASELARAVRSLAELDTAIAELETQQQAATEAMLAAGEEYVIAVEEYQQATDYADQTAEQAQVAGERAQQSRRFVARIAREASRGSNALDALGAFFLSDGLEDLVAETEALNKVDAKTDEKLQQFQADKLVSDILQRKALEATQEAREKRDAANSALKTAQQLEAQAEENTRKAEEQRTQLVAEAAAARQASIEEEEQRQAELAAQRNEAQRQAALDRIARQEEQARNDNVEVDEVPRPSETPVQAAPEASEPEAPAPAEPSAEPEATPVADPEPEPSRTTASPRPTATSDPDPEPEPEPTRTTASPTPTPTPTRTPTPTPTPTPTRTPTPTPTKDPAPKPTTPSSDPNGLGKGISVGSASKGNAAIAEAKKHLGKPYLLGASGPGSFDCSGLTSVAWSAAGVSITRTSRSQYKRVLKISLSNIRPGDLLFWGTSASNNNADSIYHVAMYIGNGQMIEAVSPGKPLAISNVRYNSGLMPFAGRP